MTNPVIHYFDKLEDRIRGRLAKYPIIYTLIGGVAIVLFWRGVWITADQIALFFPPEYLWLDGILSVGVSVLILLITGLFVSFFVTDKIIISGLRQEKKLVEKTQEEVERDMNLLASFKNQLDRIEKETKANHGDK